MTHTTDLCDTNETNQRMLRIIAIIQSKRSFGRDFRMCGGDRYIWLLSMCFKS